MQYNLNLSESEINLVAKLLGAYAKNLEGEHQSAFAKEEQRKAANLYEQITWEMHRNS